MIKGTTGRIYWYLFETASMVVVDSYQGCTMLSLALRGDAFTVWQSLHHLQDRQNWPSEYRSGISDTVEEKSSKT